MPENHELPVDFRRILSTTETLVKFGNAYSEYVDDWTSVSGSSSLSAHLPSVQAPWTGLTRFRLGPERDLTPLGETRSEDYWIKEKNLWIRVHIVPRRALFTPTGTRHGPAGANLKSVRRTLCFDALSRQTRHEDDWRTDGHRSLQEEWTGLTGRKAKGLKVPKEPTDQ